MFRPARINLIYSPVLSMSVRGQTHRNFAQPKKCAASFRSVTKSSSTIYPAIGSIYTDADEQMIKDFRTEAKLSPSTPDKQIFENLELFTENGTAKNGAAMFFGKQPERKFPHAITRCVLFKGTNKVYIIDDKTFGGSLYQQYLQALSLIHI